MSKRHKIPMKRSKRTFSRTASNVHPRNYQNPVIMRGGIRL